tara:strand:+ start:4702 stop:5844 length:1143 start_codon:yes stop_codon:yes gene_type:complete
MLLNELLGQEILKKQLKSLFTSGQIPHTQCFTGDYGRGGLSLAIALALQLLWGEESIKSHKIKGKKLSFFLEHPDLHFLFPVSTSPLVSSKPKCSDYIKRWRSFLSMSPYGDSNDWMLSIGSENKQGNIGVEEVERLFKSLSLKSYLGGAKVCVVWGVEKLSAESGNKLLKLIEEPPANTFFIFVAETESDLLPTIQSRCQISSLRPIEKDTICTALIKLGCEENLANFYAANGEGSLGKAIKSFQNIEQLKTHEELFIECLRGAFKASGNKSIVIDLMKWANTVGGLGRTLQKEFLLYSLGFIRQALFMSYQTEALVNYQSMTGFSLEKFAPFVHSENALELIELLEKTCYAVDRNANGKILFSYFALKMTHILNKKEV